MSLRCLRRLPLLAVALALAGALGACALPAAHRQAVTVQVIGFNDYHGSLHSPGSFAQHTGLAASSRPAVGGADALAARVAQAKEGNPLHVVVGGGDLIGASPLVSALFHDEPTVESLNRVGLELSVVGNHEFDRGRAELLRLQHGGCKRVDGLSDPRSCRGGEVGTPVPFEGAKFKWLAANVIDESTGKTLLPPYAIKVFDGVPVAFIGVVLRETPDIVTPSGVAGLRFGDEAQAVNALVPALRRQGIEAVVVLAHQGGVQAAGLQDVNGCDGDLADSPLARIVSQLDDAVDLVMGAHTHAAFNCSATTVDVRRGEAGFTRTPRPTGLRTAAGRRVAATSAGAYGRVLTEVELVIDRASRDVVAVRPLNRLVDRSDPQVQARMAGDPAVTRLVGHYARLAAPLAQSVVGRIARDLPARADEAGLMPAGELIANAQLAATRGAGAGSATVAFMNPGGVRSPGFVFKASGQGDGDGEVTYAEAFTVQPFGNSLVTLTLTAQQIKDLLEQQFAGCRGQAQTRLLVPSAGFEYRWRASRGCDERVSGVRLLDAGGAVVDELVDDQGMVMRPDKPYRITVNSFLAAGGDGMRVFERGTGRLGGPLDIDALTDYLASVKAPASPTAGPGPRIVRLP